MKQPKSYKGNISLYLILLLVVTAIMYSLKTCSHTHNRHDNITPSGGDTIDVAIEYSPLSLYSYNDTLGGLNYDLIREIATRKSLNIKFHPIVSLTEAINHLNNGNYDILIAEVPMTAEFKEKYLFTDPIYLDRQVLVQLKDSLTGNKKIQTQLDLAGDTIWAVANSPIAQRIKNLASEIGDTIYIMSDSTYAAEQLFLRTAVGEIKYAVINEGVAKSLAKDYPLVDIETNISFTQFQSWLINPNESKLCDSLNVWINEVKQTNRYNQILSKYNK